ncbi:hypothetical protein T492DRAFT_891133 [Pavlovales sp. CCMP2436]|nr:hypothetical protein T492DRAFT_891133 [Pavlovales sp. CCMP2436]
MLATGALTRDDFLREKIGNLCAHMRTTYGGDAATEALYALPLQVARHLIARHLVPHRRLLETGDSAALLQLCRDDTKVLAYLTLFCAAVEPPPLDDLAAMNMRDPTDVMNVSVEGVGERMQMARAAERMQEPKASKAPKAAPPPSFAPPPPPKATKAESAADREANEFEDRQGRSGARPSRPYASSLRSARAKF